MEDTDYVRKRLEKCSEIVLSSHAERRADIRGIKPAEVSESLSKGEIIGVRQNRNPEVQIEYTESYLVLVSSESGELYYLPVYFQADRVLVTTVLKLSESNMDVLEW